MTGPVRLRPCYAADIPALTALWQQVFGDSAETIAAFYHAFPRCRALAAEDETGALVSMLHVLPQTLTMEGRTYPAAYLYAVATREDCRGRGLAGTLLQFTEALLERLGYRCAVLVPAEQPLFGFYARLGYEPVFLRSRTPFPGGREISQAEYHRRREALLTGPHMTYGPELYAYLQSAYGVRFYETDTGIAAAGDGYTAEVLPEDLGGQPFAMAKWLGKPRALDPGYLGFALE